PSHFEREWLPDGIELHRARLPAPDLLRLDQSDARYFGVVRRRDVNGRHERWRTTGDASESDGVGRMAHLPIGLRDAQPHYRNRGVDVDSAAFSHWLESRLGAVPPWQSDCLVVERTCARARPVRNDVRSIARHRIVQLQ